MKSAMFWRSASARSPWTGARLQQGNNQRFHTLVSFCPKGSGSGVGCVGDDALPRIHPGSVEATGEKRGTYKLAGKKLAYAEKVILKARSELSICGDVVDQVVQELECALQFATQVGVLLCSNKFSGYL